MQNCDFLHQSWGKIEHIRVILAENVVQLPLGNTSKNYEGVPTHKGNSRHTCRNRTTLPPRLLTYLPLTYYLRTTADQQLTTAAELQLTT